MGESNFEHEKLNKKEFDFIFNEEISFDEYPQMIKDLFFINLKRFSSGHKVLVNETEIVKGNNQKMNVNYYEPIN